jgi:hypothetical protein
MLNRTLFSIALLALCSLQPAAAAIPVVFSGSGGGGDATLTLADPVSFEITTEVIDSAVVFAIIGAATGDNTFTAATGLTFSVNGGPALPIDNWRDGSPNFGDLTTADTFIYTTADHSFSIGDTVVLSSGDHTITSAEGAFDLPTSGTYEMFMANFTGNRISLNGTGAEPVPTLTEWGIFLLILVLAGSGFLHVRKLQSGYRGI